MSGGHYPIPDTPDEELEAQFRLLHVWKSERNMKIVFDHMRNLGIIAIVAAAALWGYHRLSNADTWFGQARYVLVVSALTALAFYLFFLNAAHFIGRVLDAGWSDTKYFTFMGLYSLCIGSVLLSLIPDERFKRIAAGSGPTPAASSKPAPHAAPVASRSTSTP